MKTKQEQIEEIAKIIDEMYWVYDTTAGDIAEGLYNTGYRKAGEVRKETAKEILLLLGKGYDETEKTEFNNLQWYKEFCRELKHRYGVEVEE